MVHAVAADLDLDDLGFRPDEESNSIAWLLWHIARVQDDHIAGAAGSAQVWTEAGWCDRFGLPFEPSAHGYGQTPAEAALVVADAALLRGYHDAVHQKTVEFLQGLDAESLDRVVDRSFDPPVTLGVRLVSILSDNLQHAGQAAYLGGLALRRAH